MTDNPDAPLVEAMAEGVCEIVPLLTDWETGGAVPWEFLQEPERDIGRKIAAAALAALRRAQWRITETAPRNGDTVLVGWFGGPVTVASRQLGVKRMRDGMPTSGHEFPTIGGRYPDRWQPLPQPPETTP